MRAVLAWSETPPEKDSIRNVCYDCAFNPDGTELVTGIGSRVLVYDAVDGDLLHALKGHKDAVYCVAYASDGKRFASGGADSTIIIWTSNAEGILKYSHQDPIQALAYNPVTQQLASATASDFGLWSPEQKSVAKHKVSSKILSLAWTSDGQLMALGHFNGTISIRDKAGSEKTIIERSLPIWTLAWAPNADVLAVGCWDGTLSFYSAQGAQISKDKDLEANPCCIQHFSNGEYIVVGGTDRQVMLYTKEGTKLGKVADRDAWCWSVRAMAKQNFLAVGCEDGSISVYQLIFSTVHGLYQDRYAYRDFMTDVIIQHLITEQKVRIKCRDYVKKIAVYKDRLAVQLPDRVVIYELQTADAYDMHYRSARKIQRKLECNLLVVTSAHVILCQERKLQLLDADGVKEREWVLESVIRYIKVVGGPEGREGLLVGLKSGLVLKIFIDNPFPIQLVKHTASVRCLDLSASRNRLAAVDENARILVYDLLTKELMFEDSNANSVAWNSEFEDMFCFSGNGLLSIKTGDFPLHQQKLQGFVVGFKGSKIFCLHYVSMQTIDVPQSASLYRYLERGLFDKAYEVACLGVTMADWKQLALDALQGMQLGVAKKAFIRTRDMRYIDLVHRCQAAKKSGLSQGLFLAEVLAYEGRYQEAAKAYSAAGATHKAMEMFSDLRQFDEAKQFAEANAAQGDLSSVQDLIHRQAEWSEEVNDFQAAADMYIKAGKFDKAIAVLGRNGWWDKLMTVARSLDKRRDVRALQACVGFFRKAGQTDFAKEVYIKLEDYENLASLYVDSQRWDEAFLLIKAHNELRPIVMLPYAKWLAFNDRFEEARLAYQESGRPDQAVALLESLAYNAVLERRFADASSCLYQLAMEALREVANPPVNFTFEDQKAMTRFAELYNKAEIYHAYAFIHESIDIPFSTQHPTSLFNMARFLLMKLTTHREAPLNVSVARVLHVLASHAVDLEAYKLARNAYQRLQQLKVPPDWQEEIDLATVCIRAKPYTDADELLPICYRCGANNPLLNSAGDVCINCSAAFVRSFVTFEHLPLIEFELEPGIGDEEAAQLLAEDAGDDDVGVSIYGVAQQQEEARANANVLTLDDGITEAGIKQTMEDPFTQQAMVPNAPILASRGMLQKMKLNEVIVRRWDNPVIPAQYFRVMDTELLLHLGPCGHFFEQDEFEMATLERGHAPFSRAQTVSVDTTETS